MNPSHEFLEHTSETRMRVRAASIGELLAEAGRGLAALELRGASRAARGAWREVQVESRDRAALLVDWLNELILVAEREHSVPREFEILEAGDARVRARVRGVPCPEGPSLVKAATLNDVRFGDADGMLEAEVTLDV